MVSHQVPSYEDPCPGVQQPSNAPNPCTGVQQPSNASNLCPGVQQPSNASNPSPGVQQPSNVGTGVALKHDNSQHKVLSFIGDKYDVEKEDLDEWMDLLVYRYTYWSNTARSPTEQKKPFSHPPTSEFDLSKYKFTNAQGKFQYPEVWETKFYLHTRLKQGQGHNSQSRGIQAQNIPSVYLVTNRIFRKILILLCDQTFMWFAVSKFLTSLGYQIPYIFVLNNALKLGLSHVLLNTY